MKNEQKPLETGFGESTTAREIVGNLRLERTTILITGGHLGIGFVNTKSLSEAGAPMVVGARDTGKTREILAELKNVTVDQLDLADPIRRCFL